MKEVFVFYHDYVKPLYCEIEARNNKLPVELLFEIHAAFDHLKRIHVEQEDSKSSCHKAISHLKRGALDAFKLKLKYFNQDITSLQKSKTDLSLLDNGQFWPGLLAAKSAIMSLGKNARLQESNPDPSQAFELWSQTSVAIDDFYEKYLSRTDNLDWAKKKSFIWLSWNTILNLCIGFFTGCVSSYLIWYFTSK